MAEVDFGDSELFHQLDDRMHVATHIRFSNEEDDPKETSEVNTRLGECEETIRTLTEENQELKRKLGVLTRPGGVIVENDTVDGPLLQILYANNGISKQCRKEIEDYICSIIQKHHQKEDLSSFKMNPQNSSFVIEEHPKVKTSCALKSISEAFNVVGSVMYFTSFCLDKLGQPLLQENPELTPGWEVPTYQQMFSQVITVDGQDLDIKSKKRSRPCCFNCGLEDHQLRDCPQPKDNARINAKRKEFAETNSGRTPGPSSQRYHAEVEERFAKFKPGIISEELLSALGVTTNALAPLIYRMRQLGYPPGWLKEAEMENSGITLYDGNDTKDCEPKEDTNGHISYDVAKLVDFPGFNVATPPGVKDEYRLYGFMPIQQNHMKHNFAAYLANAFPSPGANLHKRRHESDSDATPTVTKKRKSSLERSSDMDLDSDQSTPHRHRNSDSFQFQSPLPPGSPSFGSPPPLPHGTPPATPTPPPLPRGTPPRTPSNSSPALQGRSWRGGEEPGAGEEDGLTLEELEEQQRLIWAALENADTATNSDSETPAMGTPVPSSPAVSTPPAHVDTESEMEESEAEKSAKSAGKDEVKQNNAKLSKNNADKNGCLVLAQDDSPRSPEPIRTQGDSPQSPEPITPKGENPSSGGPTEEEEESPPSPELVKIPEESPLSPDAKPSPQENMQSIAPESAENQSAVPHRSKFAAGIIPFEDTPEFTEVSEATGTYLKIRDVLKCSPRNLAKNKK